MKIWRKSENFFLDILGFYTDSEYGDFSHPRRGYDFSFIKKGTGLGTRYSNLRPCNKPSPVKIEDWKQRLRKLDTVVKPYTRRQVRSILAGEDPE